MLSANDFQLCPTDYTSYFPFNSKLIFRGLYYSLSVFLLSSTKGLWFIIHLLPILKISGYIIHLFFGRLFFWILSWFPGFSKFFSFYYYLKCYLLILITRNHQTFKSAISLKFDSLCFCRSVPPAMISFRVLA